MRWTFLVSLSLACASCGPERGASLVLSEAPTPTAASTTTSAPTTSAPSSTSTETLPPPPLEAIEPGPFLTADDGAVLARQVPLPGARTVIVPTSLSTEGRPGARTLYPLAGERFVYVDPHRVAVLDAAAGRLLGTRVLGEPTHADTQSVTSDRAGRFVSFARSDEHVCVWDLDLDRVDCTSGVAGLLGPGGRSLFVEEASGTWARLDLSSARRHELAHADVTGGVLLAAVSPSERRLLATRGSRVWPHGGVHGRVSLLDAADGSSIRELADTVLPRAPFRPEGGTWVTWTRGSLEFRDTLTGALRRREPLPDEPHRMFWSPDGASVVAYHYVSGRAIATRFDATTGEPRGELPLGAIAGFVTPGFRPDGTFDFFEEFEVPSVTGRTAARVHGGGLTLRDTSREDTTELADGYEEDTVLDVVSRPGELVLVTPFGSATLSSRGLVTSSNALFGLLDRSIDDPPSSEGEDWTNASFDEAGLLGLGASVFVDRYSGTPYVPRGVDVGVLPGAPVPCDPTSSAVCCLATGSFDERTGRRVVRRLDRLEILPGASAPDAIRVSLSSCDEECQTFEQCDGQECTVDTTDPLSGTCMLRPDEEPRFDADGRVVVTAGAAGAVETFEVASSRRLGRIARARGEELPTQAFDIAPDASVVAFARGRNLHLHEVSGERRGTAEARFARPVRFVRFLAAGPILVGLVDDSLHFVDATTLTETSALARPGFRADAPSRLASVLCREGSLRWLDHVAGASAEAAREIGHCDRDARLIVTEDLAFVVEVQGARVVLHRVDDGRTLQLSLGRRIHFDEELDDAPRAFPWAIARSDTGSIERTPETPFAAFAPRTGGVRHGAFSPAFSRESLAPIVAAFLAPAPAAGSPTPSAEAPGEAASAP